MHGRVGQGRYGGHGLGSTTCAACASARRLVQRVQRVQRVACARTYDVVSLSVAGVA